MSVPSGRCTACGNISRVEPGGIGAAWRDAARDAAAAACILARAACRRAARFSSGAAGPVAVPAGAAGQAADGIGAVGASASVGTEASASGVAGTSAAGGSPGGIAPAFSGTLPIALQPVEIVVERFVQRDQGAPIGAGFATQTVVDVSLHRLMQHDTMAGEHDFDYVARQEAHDHVDRSLAASEFLRVVPTGAFAYGAFARSLRANRKSSAKPKAGAVSIRKVSGAMFDAMLV